MCSEFSTFIFPLYDTFLSSQKGVLQPVAPITAEQRLAQKNELKARGTLLMALRDKNQLKFNSHKDAIEKRFGGNIETKKVQKTLLKQQFKNFTVSAAASVSTVCAKLLVSSLLNVDSLSNAIDVDDLEEMDLRWHMAILTMRARRKGHFSRECRSLKDSKRTGAIEPHRRTVPSYQAEEEPANYAFMAFSSSNSSSDNEPPSSLYDRFQLSGGYHIVPPPYTGTFMPPKPDLVFNTSPTTVETDHLAFNVQLSPTKPEQDLSYATRPIEPIIKDWVSNSKDESENKAPQFVPSFVQSSEQVKSPRHSVQPIKTSIPAATHAPTSLKSTSSGKRIEKLALGNPKQYAQLTHTTPQKHMTPTVVLTQSKPMFNTAVRPALVVSAAQGNPQHALKDKGVINSGCSRHMTGNMSYLFEFEELNGGYVAFGGNPKGGKISGKGKIKTGKLDFDDVYFVKELKFNLFSVSKMCDKKNSVLFTNTECLVLYPDFKLPDESQVLLRVPRENNIYNVNLKNIIPSRDLTCLFAKATIDESNLWHRRLGHINFKTINKLVNGNLVRGLPTKIFENDNTCVACKKGKQHRASCKTKPVSSVDQPLFWLHMDLFGPTFVKSLNKKSYCLVIIDDYSRFTWVFFLASKDETSLILKTFITGLENQLSLKVKVMRSDNGTEFKNYDLNQFCRMKGIKREFSNRVLVTKLHNKTPYELLHGRTPNISFMRPFGCPVTILNTLDSLGKFKRKDFWLDTLFIVKPLEYLTVEHVLFKRPYATFDEKEHDVDAKKPESEVILSPSSSAQSRKQDDKTKKKAKGKSHVESFIGYKHLNAEFEDCSDNSSNEVNAVGSIVPTVGQNSFNSTNTFSAAELEDITYSDDEDVVGAEADFNNLESFIPEEPKRVHQALKDPSWIKAMQEELLQFKMQKEEGIDYKEVFAPIARIEAIRLFLAYASFMGFMVYQMDVKSAFLYGTIKEEVYVCQPPGFEDLDHPDKVYKVVKALYGLHQAPRAWYETLATYLLENADERQVSDEFYRGTYILFESLEKPLLKDPDGEDVDVHTYRKQTVVSTSSTKAEYVAVASCCA
uniref:Putative ribonuclease H-like domain-containing protein n=1 Tax=Tanacetum cinerariifolium TaxID=118510 RepID=A0A699GY96_TANCI|nr:putative ribonuclease H-like domain-containing protein [Tanacetum cinerariifolium]